MPQPSHRTRTRTRTATPPPIARKGVGSGRCLCVRRARATVLLCERAPPPGQRVQECLHPLLQRRGVRRLRSEGEEWHLALMRWNG